MAQSGDSREVSLEENKGKAALAPSECSNDFKSAGSGELSDEFILHAYKVIMSQTGSSGSVKSFSGKWKMNSVMKFY